jgi:hypothetical protein
MSFCPVAHAEDYAYEKTVLSQKDEDFFEVKVEYPQITDTKIPVKVRQTVNNKLRDFAYRLFDEDLQWFTKHSRSMKEELGLSEGDSLELSFEVIRFDENYLSIKFYRHSYGMGAAHGVHETICFNYDLKKMRFLRLRDLFKAKTNYLKQVSEYSIRDLGSQLNTEKDPSFDYGWIEGGASPVKENFTKFTISKDHLIVYFDPYEVACYAAGQREVKIPFNKLKGSLL